MNFRVLLPDRTLFEGEVTKVRAETTSGSRGFLPRHIDYVAPLRQGFVIATDVDGKEHYVAVNRGLLVKKGDQVTVTTPQAAYSQKLDELTAEIAKAKAEEDRHARAATTAALRLETRLVKEFLELVR